VSLVGDCHLETDLLFDFRFIRNAAPSASTSCAARSRGV